MGCFVHGSLNYEGLLDGHGLEETYTPRVSRLSVPSALGSVRRLIV
jgi:hypothetical protein